MIQKFIENGYKIVENHEKADIYIINTCTVTNMSDRKSRQMLRRVKELNSKSIVVACGCYAQVAKEELKKIPEIDLIIGNNVITGYDSEITPERIKNTITYYSNFDYKDKVGIYLGTTTEEEENLKEDGKKYEDAEVNIPILGKKKSKEVPILLSTILIGLVDGFNPCAMWILIFLISMLLGMKNVKRKWALGITFLLSSALVYFLFLILFCNVCRVLLKSQLFLM